MKKRCQSCPYFSEYKNLAGKLLELEFWQKHALKALAEKETRAKESAKEITEINRELERILCAFKLIYRRELEEAKATSVAKEEKVKT
jgi:hypothetical protein